MSTDIIFTIIGSLLSILGAGIASNELVRDLVRHVLGTQKKAEKTYSERLSMLTASLMKASGEVDSFLAELALVARSRESAIQKLEGDLQSLQTREKELKEKLEALEKVPLPVAEHFAKLLESGEKRSTRRDYILFAAGVVVTTGITLIFQLVAG